MEFSYYVAFYWDSKVPTSEEPAKSWEFIASSDNAAEEEVRKHMDISYDSFVIFVNKSLKMVKMSVVK